VGKDVLIYELAIRAIIGMIAENKLRPGDRLPAERELSKQLAISRTSIREALQHLASNHVVQIKPGRGIYVHILDEAVLGRFTGGKSRSSDALAAVKNLVEMRILLETHGFQQVAKTITPEELNMLYRHEATSYAGMRDEFNADPDSLHSSADFELLIFSLQPNTVLTNFYSRLNDAWKSVMTGLGLVALPLDVRHRDHIEIIMALESGDSKRIARAVGNHLDGALNTVERLLQKSKTR